MSLQRRLLLSVLTVAAIAVLGGCAAFTSVTSEVATYGDWPGGRVPGSYVFVRLPSQQALSARQAELEAAAARALGAAGLRPAAVGALSDVVVQLGARISRTEASPWDDPLWWRWGAGYWRNPGWAPHSRTAIYANFPFDVAPRYERSVAVLLRDRASGVPLYEAHAQTDGNTMGDTALLGAMFQAAMKDFPAVALPNPRRVTVQLPR